LLEKESRGANDAVKDAQEKKAAPPAPVVAPHGVLPKMEAEKAKFIAVPCTPKDPEPKKDEKSKRSSSRQ
jgi:hypothetical protein